MLVRIKEKVSDTSVQTLQRYQEGGVSRVVPAKSFVLLLKSKLGSR